VQTGSCRTSILAISRGAGRLDWVPGQEAQPVKTSSAATSSILRIGNTSGRPPHAGHPALYNHTDEIAKLQIPVGMAIQSDGDGLTHGNSPAR